MVGWSVPESQPRIHRVNKVARRRRLVVIGVISGVVACLGLATASYGAYFSDRALPGVSVLGESVTGKTAQEIATMITERSSQVAIDVTVDGRTTAYGLGELGATVDVDATIAQVFAENQTLGSRLTGALGKKQVPLVVSVDKNITDSAVQKLTAANHIPSVDAKVAFDENTGSFASAPGLVGSAVDPLPLVQAVNTAASTLQSTSLTLAEHQVAPKISDADAERIAAEANKIVDLDVTVAGKDTVAFSPTRADKASWVTIPGPDSAEFVATVDSAKVTEWVDKTTASANVEAVNGVRSIDENGKLVKVSTEAVDGWAVNNHDKVAEAITAAVSNGQNFTGEFTFDQIKATWREKKVAAGSENLIYQPAPGEKWVDLNLGNNTVTAYEGSKVVLGPVGIVPGRPGMETPTGTYSVYLKYESQTMRGTNEDGTTYEAEGVEWVSYFTGSIAFHAAPWQPSFGWSGAGGSHGCVNMSTADARFIHQWSSIGTVVVSHY